MDIEHGPSLGQTVRHAYWNRALDFGRGVRYRPSKCRPQENLEKRPYIFLLFKKKMVVVIR